MIHRREFEDKLTKELLKIVHFNSLKFFFRKTSRLYIYVKWNQLDNRSYFQWHRRSRILSQTTQRSPVRIKDRTGRKEVACAQALHFGKSRQVTEEQRLMLVRFLPARFSRHNWRISLQARRATKMEPT